MLLEWIGNHQWWNFAKTTRLGQGLGRGDLENILSIRIGDVVHIHICEAYHK
jgi:hypothetical protein